MKWKENMQSPREILLNRLNHIEDLPTLPEMFLKAGSGFERSDEFCG